MSRHRPRDKQQPATPVPALWVGVLTLSCVGAIALALFVVTLAPTVTAEDSGELIAAAWFFGIPHPPGYPLWTLLCGTFMHVFPFGEIAWRANLFSAICSAGAAVVACAVGRQVGLSRSVSAAAALVWVWSEWSWSQSVVAEVYGLNSLLTAGVLLCVVRAHRSGGQKPLVSAAFLLGLGMAHHHVIAFVGLAVLIWVLAVRPAVIRQWRLALVCMAAFVVGLLPYLYLPIRAQTQPVMNWGDPSTVQRAWAHATRQAYGTLGPTPSAEPRSVLRVAAQMRYLGGAISADLTPWLACAAACGLFIVWRRDGRVFLLLMLLVLCTGPLFVLVANFDLDRTTRWLMRVFFIPASLGLAISIGYLLEWMRGAVYARLKRARSLATVVVAVLVAVGPAVQAISHWDRCNYSNYWYAYDHAQNLMRCMMPDAIVFPYGDYSAFPLVYLHMVEGRRPDLLLATYSGRVRPELYKDRPPDSQESAVAWLIKHARRPAYCTVKRPSPLPPAKFVEAGLLFYLKPSPVAFNGSGLIDNCEYRNLREPTVRDLGAEHIMIRYRLSRGLDQLARGDREHGLEELRTAARLGHGLKGVLHEVGVNMFYNGAVDEAIDYCARAADLDPRYTQPRWALVQMFNSRERWADARGQLLAIISADPASARACVEMGYLLRDHFGDLQGAVRHWRAALARNPRLTQVREVLEQVQSGAGGP